MFESGHWKLGTEAMSSAATVNALNGRGIWIILAFSQAHLYASGLVLFFETSAASKPLLKEAFYILSVRYPESMAMHCPFTSLPETLP